MPKTTIPCDHHEGEKCEFFYRKVKNYFKDCYDLNISNVNFSLRYYLPNLPSKFRQNTVQDITPPQCKIVLLALKESNFEYINKEVVIRKETQLNIDFLVGKFLMVYKDFKNDGIISKYFAIEFRIDKKVFIHYYLNKEGEIKLDPLQNNILHLLFSSKKNENENNAYETIILKFDKDKFVENKCDTIQCVGLWLSNNGKIKSHISIGFRDDNLDFNYTEIEKKGKEIEEKEECKNFFENNPNFAIKL